MATKEVRKKEVTRILTRDGNVRASVLLKESTPKKAPLHDEFEWDDKVAAHEHRLRTSRRIIKTTIVHSPTGVAQRLVHVPVEVIEGPTAANREHEGCYKVITEIVKDSSEYQRALRQLQVQVGTIQLTIADLRQHAGEHLGDLLPTLVDAMEVARSTIRLMLEQAS